MEIVIAPLFSGSSGNCAYVGAGKTRLLVDAGRTCSQISGELAAIGLSLRDIEGVLITHEHTDHVRGLDVMMRKYGIPAYASQGTWNELYKRCRDVDMRCVRVIDKHDFYIGDINVQPFDISHDAACPYGYALSSGRSKVCVATDTGRVTSELLAAAENATIVILESNHDVEMLKNGRYPYHLKRRILSSRGHLSNDAAAAAALELVRRGVRGILLGHLSKDNNREELALATVKSYLGRAGVVVGRHVSLAASRSDGLTGVFYAK